MKQDQQTNCNPSSEISKISAQDLSVAIVIATARKDPDRLGWDGEMS